MFENIFRPKLVGSLSRPQVELYEGWVDGTIDAAKWTTTNSATGPGWSAGAIGAYMRATETPALNEVCRMVSDQLWIAGPNVYGTNTILRALMLEFELRLTNVANLDNAITFLGLTSGAGDTRASQNLIGWALVGDVLQSVTDNGGVETVDATFGETLTNFNKLTIAIAPGIVAFYVNEVMVTGHITNLPDAPMYINYYLDTEAGGGATIELGVVRAWYEDFI